MDRRGFLAGLLGLTAGAALPAQAVEFLSAAESLTDADFCVQAELSITDIVAQTIRMRAPLLAESVHANNALLKRLAA